MRCVSPNCTFVWVALTTLATTASLSGCDRLHTEDASEVPDDVGATEASRWRPLDAATSEYPSDGSVDERLAFLCACPVDGEAAQERAFRDARLRTTSRQTIARLHALADELLASEQPPADPKAFDPGPGHKQRRHAAHVRWRSAHKRYRRRSISVLLGVQSCAALSALTTRWLASADEDERLAGIVGRGKMLLYGDGPPALREYYVVEEPVRDTAGRREQAQFYAVELARWVADFDRLSSRFLDLVQRTAASAALCSDYEAAAAAYDLALREPIRTRLSVSADHADLLEVRFLRADNRVVLGQRVEASGELRALLSDLGPEPPSWRRGLSDRASKLLRELGG